MPGAAAGKARNLHHRAEVEQELAGVITPGTSGILAFVSALDADAVAQKMPKAEQVKTVPVDEETAGAIKAAATAAAQNATRDPSLSSRRERTRSARRPTPDIGDEVEGDTGTWQRST